MSKIFFTSDLHFSHRAMLNFCPKFRPFTHIQQMNAYLTEYWNNQVSVDDEVYNLGDFSFERDFQAIVAQLKRLNGKHHFILGNHDELIRAHQEELLSNKKADGNPILSSISDYANIVLPEIQRKAQLFHYPMQEWDGLHRGDYCLYGHVHNQIAPIPYRTLNVGYDLHGRFLTEQDLHFFLEELPVPPYPEKNKTEWQRETDRDALKYMLKYELQKRNQ